MSNGGGAAAGEPGATTGGRKKGRKSGRSSSLQAPPTLEQQTREVSEDGEWRVKREWGG